MADMRGHEDAHAEQLPPALAARIGVQLTAPEQRQGWRD